jgi:capsular polysaccharide biosynthesis protein
VTTQQPSKDWEDGIDLRQWINALIRRWRLVGAIVTAFVLVAIIYSYGFQASVYESSGGATLPSVSSESGIGLTPQGYQEFANSTPVMESVREKLGLDLSAGQLRNYYSFQVNEDNFITVRATADSSEQAFRLASAWLEAYGQQVQAHLQQKVAQRKSDTIENADRILAELASTREQLAEFNLENPANSMESRLVDLETELSQRKQRLREITVDLMPGADARLASLEDSIAEGTGAYSGRGTPGTSASLNPGLSEFAPAEESNISPAHLELTQSLTRSQLAILETELVDSEGRLRELTLTSIPIAETRLTALERVRSTEPKVLFESSDNEFLSDTLVPNPVYVQLSQDLYMTEVRLETEKKEAELLEKKVPVLRRQIGEIRSELVLNEERSEELRLRADTRKEMQTIESELTARSKEVARLEATVPDLEAQIVQLRRDILTSSVPRQELESEVAKLSEEYNSAKNQLIDFSEVESNLTSLTSLTTIREPSLSADLTSPKRSRNIGLAAFIGLLVGAAVALSWDFYRSQPALSRQDSN